MRRPAPQGVLLWDMGGDIPLYNAEIRETLNSSGSASGAVCTRGAANVQWTSFVLATWFVFLMGIAFRYRTIGSGVLMLATMMLSYGFIRGYGFPVEALLPFTGTCVLVGLAVLRQRIVEIRAARRAPQKVGERKGMLQVADS